MKRLEHIKNKIIDLVHDQVSHIENVDYEELGGAIDMIKDLAETIYYCTVTDAMHNTEKKEPYHHTMETK